MYVLLIIVAMVAILLLPIGKSERHSPGDWRVGAAFAAFVATLGSSPIISAYLSAAWGAKLGTASLFNFLWVGIASSLPLSLLCARAFGRQTYAAYLAYVERSSRAKILTLVAIWAIASTIAFAYGFVLLS
ncbi:hypothetical protein CLG96_06060 [Sphingomonas oleivorans]|uniref:Sodium:solute symporter n=1 Tax=Sphingomonas oleivorans TaxID=1735121 RepID=A0A2T5FZJ4_9SPHN|nr:hypothetical protein CLG96_06060 [Sphingomonas oleivorans]